MSRFRIGVPALLLAGLLGCGGDSDDDDAASTPLPDDITAVEVILSPAEVIGGGSASGGAEASFNINQDDNGITGSVDITDISPSAVTLKAGFAGETGSDIIALEEETATRWSIPPNSGLTAAETSLFNRGGLYIEVSTSANPDGALRGQLLPDNIQVLFTHLSGAQEIPLVSTAASGIGAATFDSDTREFIVHLTVSGLDDATAAHVHEALAGVNGDVVIELGQDSENVAHWFSEAENLDTAQVESLNAGRFYLNVHTPAHPGGELRGQIQPPGIDIFFTSLSGADVVPPVSTDNTGTAATTLQTDNRVMDLHVNLEGIDDAMEVTVNEASAGQNGPVLFSLSQDSAIASHWMLQNQTLSEAQYTALNNQELYVVVSSPEESAGELRGQLEPSSSSPPAAVTLTSLQQDIFTPSCAVSGCHTGASPPQGLNLSAGQTYSNTVGVMSGEVPSLNRVEPGDPDNSYLVRKVEGTASVGGRMPLGSPPLSSDQLQSIRAWIAAGAEDN